MDIYFRQPALPHYRVPLFAGLNATERYTVKVFFSDSAGLENCALSVKHSEYSPFVDFNKNTRYYFYFDYLFLRKCIREKPDLVVLSWSNRQLDLVFSIPLLRANGIKVIVWGHGYSKNDNLLKQFFRFKIASLSDFVMFYDMVNAERCKKLGFLKSNKIGFSGNAIELSNFAENTDSGNFNTDFLADSSRKKIVFISRLSRENCLDLLLEAISELENTDLIVIGGGAESIKNELLVIAEDLHILENVHFLGPIYNDAVLMRIVSCCDVFCYPANMGLSAHFALKTGLPVICGDNALKHGPEFHDIENGRNGLFFKHGSSRDLFSVLNNLLNDEERLVELKKNAKMSGDSRSISIESMCAKFFDAFNKLLS